jgi:hypothetical protein
MKTLFRLCLVVAAALHIAAAQAHEIRPAVVTASFTPTQLTLEVSLNLEAAMAGISPVHRDTSESPYASRYDALRALPPAELARRFRDFESQYLADLTIEADGKRTGGRVAAIEVPEVGDTKLARISRLRLEGDLPANTRELRFAYAAELGSAVLRLPGTGGEVVALWLKDGHKSEPYVVGVGIRERTRAEVAMQYTQLGFTHILPYGLDHILFVLGLFLLSVQWRPLLIQVTAFTVAHTITLALTIYGVFSLPSTIVEPLIAASIVYVAVENIATSRLHAWRPFVVFGFGLLHGMGFAGVLEEIGLPRAEFLTGLITFNVGVELGQLTVITLAYLAVGHHFKERPWYRARIVVPASAAIALVGAYWTVERVFF